MAVASACCAAVTTADDPVAVDAAHRDHADVVAGEAPLDRERLQVADQSLSWSLRPVSTSFSPSMRSDFALDACRGGCRARRRRRGR